MGSGLLTTEKYRADTTIWILIFRVTGGEHLPKAYQLEFVHVM